MEDPIEVVSLRQGELLILLRASRITGHSRFPVIWILGTVDGVQVRVLRVSLGTSAMSDERHIPPRWAGPWWQDSFKSPKLNDDTKRERLEPGDSVLMDLLVRVANEPRGSGQKYAHGLGCKPKTGI